MSWKITPYGKLRINSTHMQVGKNIYTEHINIGVSSNDVGHVDLVSAEIRKKI